MPSVDDELIELASRLMLQRSVRSLANDLARFGLAAPSWAPALKRGERIDYVVCLPLDQQNPLALPDNRRGRCSQCRCRIQYRPAIPKRPPKLCVSCTLRRVRGDA